MSGKQDHPPPYGAPPNAPQPVYGSGPSPYADHQQQPYYQPGPQMGYYDQQQGTQGYYNQQQGPFPAGHGPYPPPGGPYGQPPMGYMPQQRERRGPGLCEGLLAGLACCCCLDLLF
ncbi:hypothetical protein S40285_00906 [Stachybotrys chlorohalonatus IBT 40285]|uniref:Cysteine-rich transmembrane domain-containing protein n=1 Tax=Stachybotrys chlorohalonatus (strain IBT 40285) TaxID=1283841 RepID=A0A084QUV5_STAC4|nr:hypothetical protein S40285_00906 [Stachybotrys chlorohalonata IBT 40285]